jgi:hypothetical protein
VVRLLLSGTPPGRILCLTFTRAAAATMAVRIHERLGRWVALDEGALAAELMELSGERPGPAEIGLARRLFARAVETPGGLKIETLHAFCERLLHSAPFEAGVPARFAVLDEAQADEALSQAIDNALADAASGARPDLAEALGTVGLHASGDRLRAAIRAAAGERAVHHDDPEGPDGVSSRLRRALGLEVGETAAAIERAMIEDGLAPGRWAGLSERLRAESAAASDRGVAERLQACAGCGPGRRLDLYLAIFFTKEGDAPEEHPHEGGQPRSPGNVRRRGGPAFGTRGAPARGPDPGAHPRPPPARGRHPPPGRSLKARQGALDFDDLVARTLDLLERGEAGWLLYKLDRGIDHVLVDEAQDTNPRQWAILRHVTEDFTAGHGARGGTLRTLFAVGDPKQSIYSFQGAAPHEFEESRRFWRERTLGAARRFEDVRLFLSFRSARTVLTAVDATFAHPAHFKGLSLGDDVRTAHESARPEAPGLVELWPTEIRREEPDPDAWTPPAERPEPPSPPARAAARIAEAVKCWTTEGDERGRIHRAGDVLVLARTRGSAFEAVIRALRRAGVPVAGQDRLDVAAHIAVLDLVAAGRAALLPADNLNLAAALKTPLVDLTDDDLVRIAAGRLPEESLVAALRRHADEGRPCGGPGPRGPRPLAGARRSPRPVRVLRGPARAGGGPRVARRPARRRGRRRRRRVPGRGAQGRDGAGRALPHHLPVPLRGAGRRARPRGQARARRGPGRGAGDDGARLQGAGGADRGSSRRLRRARARAGPGAGPGRRPRPPRLVAAQERGLPCRRRGPRRRSRPGPRRAQPAPLRRHDPGQGPPGDRALLDGPNGRAGGGLVRDGPPEPDGGRRRSRAQRGALRSGPPSGARASGAERPRLRPPGPPRPSPSRTGCTGPFPPIRSRRLSTLPARPDRRAASAPVPPSSTATLDRPAGAAPRRLPPTHSAGELPGARPRSVAGRPASSWPRYLPGGRAVLVVLERDAHGRELVANAVGFGPILGGTGAVSGFYSPVIRFNRRT